MGLPRRADQDLGRGLDALGRRRAQPGGDGASPPVKTAALELAPLGIRVNALAPDAILTEGLREIAPESVDHLGGMVPMGRPGTPEEFAGAAVFLASDLSAYVTGQTIGVDGGTGAAGGWYPHPDDGHWILGPAH